MKVIPSVLLISFVLLLASVGTLASFTDVETASGEVFTAGTMDLYMEDNGPDINEEWTLINMVPGMSSIPGQLNIYNIGTMEADKLEVKITFATECTEPGMDGYLKVDSMKYTPYSSGTPMNLLSYVSDSNSNGFIDLADLNGFTLDNLPAPAPTSLDVTGRPVAGSSNNDFNMEVSFDINAPNEYQGDTTTLTMRFEMKQK